MWVVYSNNLKASDKSSEVKTKSFGLVIESVKSLLKQKKKQKNGKNKSNKHN